ncbi:MAG: hypothetical protein FJ388_06525, partial [Verrucomicrobia bacterium]|nr:hypothetical protein [Verrucomicrobiota bacterium]
MNHRATPRLAVESDQLNEMKFLRTHLNRVLAGETLQKGTPADLRPQPLLQTAGDDAAGADKGRVRKPASALRKRSSRVLTNAATGLRRRRLIFRALRRETRPVEKANPMRQLLTSLASLSVAFLCYASTAHALQLQSPDGKLTVTFDVKDFGGAKGCAVYGVSYKGKPIVVESRLGLEIENAPLGERLRAVRKTTGSHDETWRPVWGERSKVRDHYNQLVVELRETAAPNRSLTLTFRAYDEGVAFCYTLPKPPGMESVTIKKEATEFRFAADHTTWAVYSAQGNYSKVTLSQIKPGCERPLTIQVADDCYAAIGEAKLVDYARMKFAPIKEGTLGAEPRSRRRRGAEATAIQAVRP